MGTRLTVANAKFDLELWTQGDGPPLLYLHGFEGPPPDVTFLEHLARGHRVIAPTLPGFNGSTGFEHLQDILDVVVFHHQLLESLSLRQVDVIGHNLGGMFAAEVAALCPHVVRRLVLVAPLGIWLDACPVPDFLSMSDQELAQLSWFDPEAHKDEPPAEPQDAQAAMIRKVSNRASATRFLWPIPDRGLAKRLERIQAPTLLVWGEADGIVPREYAAEFNTRIADSRLEVIKKAGHYPMVEQPAEFVRLVEQFLSSA